MSWVRTSVTTAPAVPNRRARNWTPARPVVAIRPLRAVIGSIRAARRAGKYPAVTQAASITPQAATQVATSSAPTPKSTDAINRLAPAAAASPSAMPAAAGCSALRSARPATAQRSGAERRADGELELALDDSLRDDAVDAGDDQYEREQAESRHEQRPGTPLGLRAGDHLVHATGRP